MPDFKDKIQRAHEVNSIAAGDETFRFNSMHQALVHHRKTRGHEPFLIYYDEVNQRTEISYEVFARLVLRTSTLLMSRGVKRGSRIATAAHNHPDTIVQYFAAWMIGACVVPLNMTEDDDRLRYIMDNSKACLLLCRTEYLQRMRSICAPNSDLILAIDDEYHTSLEAHPEYTAPSNPMLDDECMIVYTSGTTGNPKGVVLIQRNLMADAEGIATWHGITEHQRMACVLPVHHVNGSIVTHVTPFIAGSSVVLQRKFQTEFFFKRIRDEKVTVVSVVPTLLAFLLEANADSLNVKEHGFRHIICGAGPLTCELAHRFEERYSIPIMHGYGLSETTCYSCFLECDLSATEHEYWMQHFGFPSIGTPIPQNEMQIHDEAGNVCDQGIRGEIVIRGWNVMKEYYENDVANESAFAHSWFRSGDEGFWMPSATGKPYFFITGRLKELIIRGGVNIAPLEIDEVINRAPGVKAGISVGFESDFYGEEIGALVVAHEGASEADVLTFCQKELPFSKAPKVVLFCDQLPVTSTGKYQRNNVKHLFKEWKPVQFRKS